ncbi:MAG TPA: TonB-dependent receptor, partial [Gemmatimonadaceae bacterium]|nr:TonB-dependent receptor [Gemmatimonadaceae bacterium]
DRAIALRARDVSLREALDRIAAAARFRVSYSAEFLPLDRHVCVSSDSITAGDALAEVLAGVGVSSIVTAPDHVVLAPSRPEAAARESVQTLERVVVTGSATGSAQRPLSIAIDVISGRALDRQSAGTLAASFDGNVAGVWLWEQGPSTMLARYGSIRGASSFNVSYPKVYIDGIEVANPLLVTELNPAVVDRIEVIRGPQGAALYGADAISGVVNIVTRHEGLQAGDSRTEIVSRAGLSQTAFAEKSVLAQNHAVAWRAGSNMRSGSLAMNLTTLGGYVPEAYSRDLKLNGGFRVVSSNASFTGTARLFGKRAAIGQNPLITAFLPAPAASVKQRNRASFASREDSLAMLARETFPQTVREYTVGITSTLLSGTTWVPSFTAGVDGYRLDDVSSDLTLIPSALDSALHSAQGGADRATFRTALVGQYGLGARRSLTLTFSGEVSRLRETVARAEGSLATGQFTRFREAVSLRGNSGVVGQANVALYDALYLTGGMRIERNDGFTTTSQTVALPMAGAAVVRDVGATTIKLRGAYGVGIRPVLTSTRESAMHEFRHGTLTSSLDPERQSGVEFGADLFIGKRFGVHVTRFDQTASGLIQPVAMPKDSTASSGSGSGKRLAYVLQNVGRITNRGWELESSLDLGRASLAGAFTTVDSRVRQIARGYTGDLRIGDRMLAVPWATASLTTSWNAAGWRAGLTASRAFDWINYDRLRLARNYASCDECTAEDLTGPQLRSYWMNYDGVTRLRASVSRDLPRDLGLRVTVDNLTNAQRGEPDNITVLPGRTALVGISARIR